MYTAQNLINFIKIHNYFDTNNNIIISRHMQPLFVIIHSTPMRAKVLIVVYSL